MSEKEENKINVEDLINKKRDEVIAKVKADTKGLEERIMSDAISHFAIVAEELKQAYSAKIVGPEDLLRAIEKGGFVHRGVVDIPKRFRNRSNIDLHDFLGDYANQFTDYRELKGKQRVTIIVEPIGGERDE